MANDHVSHRQLEGLRVLIVDDNEDAAEAIAWLLTDLGAVTRCAKDALRIVDLVVEFNPVLTLMDLSLPTVDGFDACRLIRRSSVRVPYLVAVTGWADEEHQMRSREAGFDAYLTKPVSFDVLIDVGRQALRRVPG